MNLMQLPDAKRQVSEEKRGQRTKHNRFQEDIRKLSPLKVRNNPVNIAKDSKVIPDPIDDRKFQE